MARCASRRGGRAGRQQPPEQMFPSCHLHSAPPPLPPSPHRQLACTDAARPRGFTDRCDNSKSWVFHLKYTPTRSPVTN